MWNGNKTLLWYKAKTLELEKKTNKFGLKSLSHPGGVTFESGRDVVLAQILFQD